MAHPSAESAEFNQSLANFVMAAKDFLKNPTSTRYYGYLLKPHQKTHIENWLEDMPDALDFIDASTARKPGIEVYQDWINWSKSTAFAWLQRLDRYERRFRSTGLKYHKVPYSMRTSGMTPHGSKISPPVLKRLAQIFETDRSRSLQTFFTPWLEINNTATEMLAEIDSYQHELEDFAFLRSAHLRFDISFARLDKPLRSLRLELDWVESTVANIAGRSNVDGSQALAAKFSLEGGLLRRWMQTFLEIERGYAKSKSDYIESYVACILDVGVEPMKYWSMLVDGIIRKEDSSA